MEFFSLFLLSIAVRGAFCVKNGDWSLGKISGVVKDDQGGWEKCKKLESPHVDGKYEKKCLNLSPVVD